MLQDLSDDLRETLDGLSSELSAVCQHYMWLDHTQSLVDKCKREKMSDMTAETFEVSAHSMCVNFVDSQHRHYWGSYILLCLAYLFSLPSSPPHTHSSP